MSKQTPAGRTVCLCKISDLILFPEQLVALISAAKQHDVEFIYAISPGLDVTFSNPKEVAALKRKLDQVGLCMQETKVVRAREIISSQLYVALWLSEGLFWTPHYFL